MMGDFIQILSILLTAATTIIVALIQFRSKKKDKQDEENAAIRAELEEEREKARKAAEERQEQRLENVCKSVSEMQTELTEIKRDQDEIKQQITQVAKLTNYNLSFSNEINNALLNLGDALIDQTADETLRKSMQDHREKTAELQKQLYETTF